MRKIFGCFIIIMIMITSQVFAGTIYYVDATNGSDSNSGTSRGTAWKTINKVNNSSFNPGDSILFKRGEIWMEQLIVPSSGSSGNPITFGAFGSGDKPIISGADLVTTWWDEGGNVWCAIIVTEPKIVFFDGIKGSKQTTIGNVDSTRDWHWSSNVLYVYYTEDPDGAVEIEASQRNRCIEINGKDYITVDGLELKHNNHAYGVLYVADTSYIIIQNCVLHDVYYRAVYIKGATSHNNTLDSCTIYNHLGPNDTPMVQILTSDSNTISNNTIHTFSTAKGNGISLYDADSNIVENNTIYSVPTGLYGNPTSDSNIIRYNQIYDITYGNAIAFATGCDNNEIYYNLIWDTVNGITIRGVTTVCDGTLIYNNVIYSTTDASIQFTNDNTNAIVKNNIVDMAGAGKVLHVSAGSASGVTSDYNVWRNTSGTLVSWDGDDYTLAQFATYQAAKSQDASSLTSDPLMVDPANDDFILQSSSLCINVGTDISLTQDYAGNAVPYGWAVDIGAYEYQGSVSPPLSTETNASPTSGYVPLAVSFTGSASGGTSPYTYSWNFGDGSSSSDQNPSHTYSSAGTYTVTLTVTDSSSSQATDSLIITAASTTSPLSASASASTTSGEAPLTVNFTGSASGGTAPYTYSWNFGDGSSSSSEQNPSHTYSSSGSYTANLTVTDSAASQASDSIAITASSSVHEVTVPNTPEGPSTGAPGVSYTYTTVGASCSQGHSVEYYFDWGDGAHSSWSSSTSASHTWSAAGTYAVKAQARCSVDPGVTSLWSEGKTVSLEESPNFQLYISSATDLPVPGQGGSTNPDTGTYPYPAGNSVQVTALPATNYRFSKWTGDITGSDSYNNEITFDMDQDKSISALFCTQCGDVNGDLSITPADAQYVFEIFLGIISNVTETQKENADVNCDGTATEPNITPADAQAIFEKFLGISELPGNCSCRSRAEASSTAFTQNNQSQTAPLEIQSGTPKIQLTIDDIEARFGREITVPVRINNPSNIKSFGFDLAFESGTLEFAGIEIGSLLNGFTMVDANEISEGVVRVGGFSSEPILTSSPSVLVRLKFRVLGRTKEPSPLSITNTVDDIKNAATRSGVAFYKKINNNIMRMDKILSLVSRIVPFQPNSDHS